MKVMLLPTAVADETSSVQGFLLFLQIQSLILLAVAGRKPAPPAPGTLVVL